MSTEYIERGEALEMLKEVVYAELASDADNSRANYIIGAIENLPAADVEPVVHGEWKWKPPYMVCSACSRHAINRYRSKYCQHCGAKMRNPRGAHMDERSEGK